MKKFKFTKNGFAIKKAISCFASMAVLLAQLPLIQVRAGTHTEDGLTFSIDGNFYTVTSYDADTIADGEKYTGIKYILNGNTFSASKMNDSISGEKIILGSIDGKNVSYVLEEGFRECDDLTSIQIQDGVQYIRSSAFYECDNLTSVQIPNSVQTISGGAFQSCGNLTSIRIPSSVQEIGVRAFRDCRKLSSINFDGNGNSLEIYSRAFEISGITSISLPDRVTTVGDNAFYNCTALTQVSWPTGATEIPGNCFEGCTALTSFTIPEEVESVANSAFYGCTALRTVAIPEGSRLSSIGAFAFSGCTSLTQVNCLPEGLTSLDYGAFEGCSSLSSIKIPNTVESISSSVFKNCRSLTSISILCTFDLTKFSSSKVVPDNGGQTYTVLDSDNRVVCRGTFNLVHNYEWAQGANEGDYNYVCQREGCDSSIPASISINGSVNDEIEIAKGETKSFVATKAPADALNLSWVSGDTSKVTVSDTSARGSQLVLRADNNAETGSIEITASAPLTNEWTFTKTFTLNIKPHAGEINKNGYPQIYYIGQPVKAPDTIFSTNNDDDGVTMEYNWYEEGATEGGNTAPSEVGKYTLKVKLPSSTNYTGAECEVPIKVMRLPVHVADGEQGQLSMQAQQLNATKWEKADSKDAETFAKIDGSEDRMTYTPGDDDYGKYIRVVTKDDEQYEVVSEPVLVKFLKNSISFSHN